MKTLERRLLRAEIAAGIDEVLGEPLFFKVADMSIQDPDAPLAPRTREWKVLAYRSSAWFPIQRGEGDVPVTVGLEPGETVEALQARCAIAFPRVALWSPVHEADTESK